MDLSVVVPTCNRRTRLGLTLERLLVQTVSPAAYEVIVVDDGSAPPVEVGSTSDSTRVIVLHTGGIERSAARNAGVRAARGEIVVFIDDDIDVPQTFLEAHRHAHHEWPGALIVGLIDLPAFHRSTQFGRFRQRLERAGIPDRRGVVQDRNLCTAANMSIARDRFAALGGFDPLLTSGEDQDFALRHTARGGRIVFIPEARVIHDDVAVTLRDYCRRVEAGTTAVVRFCVKHPGWVQNVERQRVNGPARPGREPAGLTLRKIAKRCLGARMIASSLLVIVTLLERINSPERLLDRLYRLMIGVHIFRGFRNGLHAARSAAIPLRSPVP